MEKIVEQTMLFDFYGELLTEHQKQVFGDVILGDLSLSEAAAQYGVSRQGIHDLVRRVDAQLREYESKLHLVERFLKIRKEALQIRQMCEDGEVAGTGAGSVRQICDRILNEL
ncbi:MAG: YlxM family DNA-binding protein [Lachnospiraceae bacterium]|jgi:predicted DNA-binding protein YlxM (UPF0122 family)|nr:YlxM family DNA-binding protein [Lachnospiraceae bacterium]